MKRLLLIGGPMGVGKSAVCERLLERLRPGAYLDGDWCWRRNPSTVTPEAKAMVLDNICAVLGRFLASPEVEYVIFGWVLHQRETIDAILARLPLAGVEVFCFSLTAPEEVLLTRLRGDIAAGRRKNDGVEARSLAYRPLYAGLGTILIETGERTPDEAAGAICARLAERREFASGTDGKDGGTA